MSERRAFGRSRMRRAAVAGSAATIGLVVGVSVLVGGGGTAGAVTVWSPPGACGIVQSTVVPADVYSMTVVVTGGHGGQSGTQGGSTNYAGGAGGVVTATIAVVPGATVSAIVGCNGGDGLSNTTSAVSGGVGYSNGGGAGHGQTTGLSSSGGTGGGGGGSALPQFSKGSFGNRSYGHPLSEPLLQIVDEEAPHSVVGEN